MFKRKYSGEVHQRVFCSPGSRIRIEYAPKLDKFGNKVIVEKGKIDWQAYINSWRDDCDLNILIARYTAGDKTALMQRVGMFADVSKLPGNFNDMMNITMQAEAVFDSLPISVKQAFGNNVNNFLSNAGSEEWMELFSKSPDDFRKEIIAKSNYYTSEMKENFRKKTESSGVESEILPSDSGVVEKSQTLSEAISKVVGGKLNEQKQ